MGISEGDSAVHNLNFLGLLLLSLGIVCIS
jgi:hypothetical protein